MNLVKESPNSDNCRAEPEQRGSHLCPTGPSLRRLRASGCSGKADSGGMPLNQAHAASPPGSAGRSVPREWHISAAGPGWGTRTDTPGPCITEKHGTHRRPAPLGPCHPPPAINPPSGSFLTQTFHGNGTLRLRDAGLKKLLKIA